MGRSIDFAEIEDYTRMEKVVLEEYNLLHEVSVEMTYWLRSGEGTKPMSISNDNEVGVFRSIQKANKCVNLFATFRERVGGKLQLLGEASKLIERTSDPILSVQVGDGAGITNNDSSNVDDELRFSHVKATNAQYGGDWLMENHEQTCEKDPGRTDNEQSDEDQAYDFWTDLINKEHGEEIGGEESDSDDFVDSPVVNKLNNKVGSDGLDKEAVKKRSNESLAFKKCTRGISGDEIYGFDDVEHMFNSLENTTFSIQDIDFSKEDDEIYKGRMFKNKEDFKIAMSIYAIKRVFRFRISRHAKHYTVMQCIDRKCDWRVYAHEAANSEICEVRKANLSHQCTTESRRQFNKHATSKVVAALLQSKYGNITNGPRARDLPEMVLAEHNIDASYWKCRKARELAIAEAQGTEEKSYKILPLYLYVLKHANLGTIYHLKTEVDVKGVERFKYVFTSLGASIQGLDHLRRVVVVDGTHLHGKYKGTLLTASGQDANFQIFSIAFVVVDSENDASWSWFFGKVNEIIQDGKDLVFISDRQPSIYKAMKRYYSMAQHGACLVHLGRNISSKFKKRYLAQMVTRVGTVYRVSEFKVLYDEIKMKDEECWKYLDEIGVAHWTMAYFPGT